MWTNEKGGIEMKTKDVEKEVQRKIENIMQEVDMEYEKQHTKIIRVDLDRKSDFLRTYNDKKVDLDLIEYLIDQILLYKSAEKVKIVLNKRCEIDVNAIKLVKEGLKEEYKKSLNIRDQNNLKQLWLIAMGISLLFLSTKVTADNLMKEILLIIGWVPIWETMEVELFPDAVQRKRRRAIKRLLNCEIVERTVIDEKITSIEISKVEDEIK